MAAVDFFLKLDGIEGESADKQHKGEIDLVSWSWGESQLGASSSGGGGGAGKVSMKDFNFVMSLNKASPKLMLSCANGTHIPKAVLTCRKAGKGQQEYFKVIMSDVLVSGYQTGGSAPSNLVPVDQISLNFAKLEFEYREQKGDGSLAAPIKTGWDVKANTQA